MKKSLIILVLTAGLVFAAVPEKMHFQGQFIGSLGDPYHGEYLTRFRIYDSESSGALLWSEDQSPVLHNGHLSVYLGDITPLPDEIFDGSIRYLEVELDGNIFDRVALITVPYAYRAAWADSLVGFNLDTLGAFMDTTFTSYISYLDSVHVIDSITNIDSLMYSAFVEFIDSIGEVYMINAIDSIYHVRYIGNIDSISYIDSIGWIGHTTRSDTSIWAYHVHWDSIVGIPGDVGGDTDWEVIGDDMHSMPVGNVGIGISSPDTDNKLHVVSNGGTGERAIFGEYSATGPQGWMGTELYGAYGQFDSDNFGALGSNGIGIYAQGETNSAYLDGDVEIIGDVSLPAGASLIIDGDAGSDNALMSDVSGNLYWGDPGASGDVVSSVNTLTGDLNVVGSGGIGVTEVGDDIIIDLTLEAGDCAGIDDLTGGLVSNLNVPTTIQAWTPTIGQFIITSSELGCTGGAISSITLYSSRTGGTYSDFDLFLDNVLIDDLEGRNPLYGTNVANNFSLSINSDGSVVIPFDHSFYYSGDNLLITLRKNSDDAAPCEWYGIATSEVRARYNSSSSEYPLPSEVSFRPNITLNYLPPEFPDVVTTLNSETGDIDLVAGEGIDITTAPGSIAISSTSSGEDSDWQISTDIGDGTNDTTLVMGGKWGLFREGNVGFGNACSTHVNLGVACSTGISTSNVRYCTISGGAKNLASGDYSTVGGGFFNQSIGIQATVSGGEYNSANQPSATISGGRGNTVNANGAVIGGGRSNTNTGFSAVISGGETNVIDGDWSTIGGGQENQAWGRWATVSGGNANTSDSLYSTVAGGTGNESRGNGTFIGGGRTNSAWGFASVVSGGELNRSYGDYSVISGGIDNTVSGDHSAIPGGYMNDVLGDYSLAFGREADVATDYTARFYSPVHPGSLLVSGDVHFSGAYKDSDGDRGTSGQVLSSTGSGTNWITGGGSGEDSDWQISTDIGDGTYDTTLVTGGYWGLFRKGSVGFGNACWTHVNLGVNGSSGTSVAGVNDTYITISGGRLNSASGNNSTIGGGYSNQAKESGTVAGGIGNIAGSYSFVGGGQSNSTSTISSGLITHNTIGGGAGNQTLLAGHQTIGGGLNNTVDGSNCTIGGGKGNLAETQSATVAGGEHNSATNHYCTVGGGYQNIAEGPQSVICGGEDNTASASYSVIGGGHDNLVMPVSLGSSILGGIYNTVNGPFSSIIGGSSHEVSGDYSTVLGGYSTVVSGNYSLAFGNDADVSTNYTARFFGPDYPGSLLVAGDVHFSGAYKDSDGDAGTSGQVLSSTGTGTDWVTGGGSGEDSDWQISNEIGDGVDDMTLVTGGKWGLFREGNVGFGNACSTHVNLGVACTTGSFGSNHKYSSISGGRANSINTAYSTIGGGYQNKINDLMATISGGRGNIVNSNPSTIGGGYLNLIGSSSDYSTIGGGGDNSVDGLYTTIAGGIFNSAGGRSSTISGGEQNNTIGFRNTISGGTYNSIWGDHSVIPGGYYNDVNGDFSFAFGDSVNISTDYTARFYSPDHPGSLLVAGDVHFLGGYKDSDGDRGTSGQVLSSTGSGTNWITGGTGSGTDDQTDVEVPLTSTGDFAFISGESNVHGALDDLDYALDQLNDYNTSTTPIHWNDISGIPSGFADGVDDVGTGGGTYDYWRFQANGGSSSYVYDGNTVNFNAGSGISLSKSGNTMTISSTGSSGVTGSGTSGRAARWTGSTSLGTSAIQDNGSQICVGAGISPSSLHGIRAQSGSSWGICGSLGYSSSGNQAGVYGYYYGTSGAFGYRYEGQVYAVYGYQSSGDYAGYFNGDLHASTFDGASKSFLIDHPDDPYNKVLRHYCIESPEVLNVYRGTVELDETGEATIEMPDYFKNLVDEDGATVHPTPVGRPFMVGYEWNQDHLSFILYGDPGREVSYLVYAERNDPAIEFFRKPVVESKDSSNKYRKGQLIYPQVYGEEPNPGDIPGAP